VARLRRLKALCLCVHVGEKIEEETPFRTKRHQCGGEATLPLGCEGDARHASVVFILDPLYQSRLLAAIDELGH